MTALQLDAPLIITARLMPGARFDTFTVSLDPDGWDYYIDFHGDADGTETIHGTDFSPGAGHGAPSKIVRRAMGSLLSFVGAYAEALDYAERTGRDAENAELFPARFAQWARHESDEVDAAAWELDGDR